MKRPLAVLAVLLLAGCAVPQAPSVAPLAAAPAMTWTPGNYWAYRATFRDGSSFDVALVVHAQTPDGYRLGSNLSAGFFGLPFNGNVSRDLNPRVAGEEWPLFRAPLSEGATWSYHLFGHDATTVAHAALLDVPDLGPTPGWRFESKAYGQTFARYEYAPAVGWLTRLQLFDPTNGTRLLDARLLAYGPDFQEAYFVEETLATLRIAYPAAPGSLPVHVPAGMEHVRAMLTASADAGALDAKLVGAGGEPLAAVQALAKQTATDRASVRGGASMTWTLTHTGVGVGYVYLEVTGLSATGKLARLQSTRPAFPQDGHTTSTGEPVAVYGISVEH